MKTQPKEPSKLNSLPKPAHGRRRVAVEAVLPEIDRGMYPVKRSVGASLEVMAHLVSDGHDVVTGELRFRGPGDRDWKSVGLEALGNDEYSASIMLDRIGRWQYTVVGWIDPFLTWRTALAKRDEAGDVAAIDLELGAQIVMAARERAPSTIKKSFDSYLAALQKGSLRARVDAAQAPELESLMRRYVDDNLRSAYDRVLEVIVDRKLADYSSWYEFFPRSTGAPGVHGTFADAERMLDYVAELGFNVVYLPPIHPIGTTHRKGPNNSLDCGESDPGSPWAVGSAEGGHTAIHPELGTFADFRRFCDRARELGLEVALDIAFQASPDHPWVKEHREWFRERPDGTIQYAENPPKKYQDIYPLDFETAAWESLWDELRSVFAFWIDQGVTIFRVDNPHTKSFAFWEWCIADLKAEHPETIFLAEAFTRPKLMAGLARRGFSQSYTYFTWRESAAEMRQYLEELTDTELAEFMRPNFWPNTPDILPTHLTNGQFGAFAARLILAATLSGNYGMYGPAFELMEHTLRPGSGEYIDNEKYQLKAWDLDRPDSLRHLIARVNEIRDEHPALQQTRNLTFHDCNNPNLLCYSKRSGSDVLLVVVSFDPYNLQAGTVHLKPDALALAEDEAFSVHDLLGDGSWSWEGSEGYVELSPWAMPAHIFEIRRSRPVEEK